MTHSLRVLLLTALVVLAPAASDALAGLLNCGDGVVDGGEQCDLAGSNGNPSSCCDAGCQYRASGEACRPSAYGRCDTAETCSGASDACPADDGPGEFGADARGYDAGSGHCYLAYYNPVDWDAASNACASLGGYLAVPDSSAENTAIRSLTSTAATWIGVEDETHEAEISNRGFLKVTRGNVDYDNFAVGEPDNDNFEENCAAFIDSLSTWADRPCNNNNEYVCEIEPVSCGDGVVQGLEQCDLGAVFNGDVSTCCDSLCAFRGAGGGCKSGGTCGSGSGTCSGAADDCPVSAGIPAGAASAAFDPRTEHCYLSFTDQVPWADANTRCTLLGGALAVPDDGRENVIALALIPGGWLGVNDRSVEAESDPFAFVDTDDELITYHAFSNGSPDDFVDQEDCVEGIPGALTWNDLSCTSPHSSVCEIPTLVSCPAMPQTCTSSTTDTGLLVLKTKTGSGSILWKSGKTAATGFELGSPVAGTGLRLCVWDSSDTLFVDEVVEAGGDCGKKPCWKQTGNGFGYKKAGGGDISVVKVKLGPAGKASFVVKGQGSDVELPTLPPPLPITVQLFTSAGPACWGATFSSPAKIKDGLFFKDKND